MEIMSPTIEIALPTIENALRCVSSLGIDVRAFTSCNSVRP